MGSRSSNEDDMEETTRQFVKITKKSSQWGSVAIIATTCCVGNVASACAGLRSP
jgi:hypothetical protein